MNHEQCPNCGKKMMPAWKTKTERARACQACGHVEERHVPKDAK